MKLDAAIVVFALSAFAAPVRLQAQVPEVPDWAIPGSATHKQVAPPPDFRRETKTSDPPIGIFDGQPAVGSALVPGKASYAPATKAYTITSAGYNIWNTRD